MFGYEPDRMPTFALPPDAIENLRLFHASCRLPHGEKLDACPILALLRSGTLSNQRARLPSTEVLTSFCRRIRTPTNIAHRRIALLEGFQGRLTDHSTISHHRDLAQAETFSHALDYQCE